MKLPIENWIAEQGYSSNIKKLFHEAVIGYRNTAYRSSLLFSYLGFLTIVKETIIKSQVPDGFTEPEWKNLIQRINNDELWEKEVYEALTRSLTKKPIFKITDDLRLQLQYWKDRRNDCAHFKRNEIEAHHTEAFWSFIKSNLPKITVEGGKASLLNKFNEHFDETRTPPNSDLTHLVKEITNSVLSSEKEEFFQELKSVIDGRRYWYPNLDAFNVYDKILDVADSTTQEELIDFIKNKNIDINFLGAHPGKIVRFSYSPAEVRELWKTKIYDKHSLINPFNIYSGLLRNKLIPADQKEEAHRELFSRFSQTNYHKLPEMKDIETLKAEGFYDVVFEIAIEENDLSDFMWVNDKCDLIMSLIENAPLKMETVRSICNMTNRRNHSWWLVRELQNGFANMPELKAAFETVAKSNGITIPGELK